MKPCRLSVIFALTPLTLSLFSLHSNAQTDTTDIETIVMHCQQTRLELLKGYGFSHPERKGGNRKGLVIKRGPTDEEIKSYIAKHSNTPTLKPNREDVDD